jgi:hypothetical protein
MQSALEEPIVGVSLTRLVTPSADRALYAAVHEIAHMMNCQRREKYPLQAAW